MKVQKKVQVLQQKIGELNTNSSLEDCLNLKLELEKNKIDYKKDIQNIHHLYDIEYYLRRKNYYCLFEKKELVDRLINEQIIISHRMIFDEIIGFDEKKELANISRELFDKYTNQTLINYDLLVDLEKEINRLEQIENYKNMALLVDGEILSLPYPKEIDDRNTVICARNKYEELPNDAKLYVKNYSILLDKEGVLHSIEEAYEIDKLIDEIKDDIDIKDKNAIKEIYERYNNLDKKEYLHNENKLLNAFNKLEKLIQEENDNKLLQLIDEEIEMTDLMLNDELLDYESKYSAYQTIKNIVSVLDDTKIEMLKNYNSYESFEKKISNAKVQNDLSIMAKAIYDKINNIEDDVKLNDYDLVKNIAFEYDNLPKDAKALVNNKDILYSSLNILEAQKKAFEFERRIEEVDNATECIELINEYKQLMDIEKAYINNSNLLFEKYDLISLSERQIANAKIVSEQILSLSSDIKLSDKPLVIDILNEYELLDEKEKSYVDNFHILQEAKKKIRLLEISKYIDNLILELPKRLDVCDIVKMEQIFNVIDELDGDVMHVEKYAYLENSYHQLMNLRNEALNVNNMIETIGEITLESAKTLAEIRLDFEMLSDCQKDLVTNYRKFLNYERKLIKMTNKFPNEIKKDEIKTYAEEQIKILSKIYSNPNISDEDKNSCIESVRNYYNTLTEEEKMYIDNYEILKRL